MKSTHPRKPATATLKEIREILDCLKRCTDRLNLLLPGVGGLRSVSSQDQNPGRLQQTAGGEFDRYRWGCTVASSLAPKFDSHEFARAFRAALSPDALQVFDAVRLKKILQRLCNEQRIEMTKAGRGRTPAQYRVLPRTQGKSTKGKPTTNQEASAQSI